jgi:hypothetical protein
MKQVQLGCVLFVCALVITVFLLVALHVVLQVYQAWHGF